MLFDLLEVVDVHVDVFLKRKSFIVNTRRRRVASETELKQDSPNMDLLMECTFLQNSDSLYHPVSLIECPLSIARLQLHIYLYN